MANKSLQSWYDDISVDPNLSIKQKELLLILKGCKGNLSLACDECGISRKVHYYNLKNNESYKYYYDQFEEIYIDAAERVIQAHLDQNNLQAAMWLLSKKGKKRGYEADATNININQTRVVEIVYMDEPQTEVTHEIHESVEVKQIESTQDNGTTEVTD